jgi:hypothetical protein
MKLYEINTAVWLGGRRLEEVDWDPIAALGVDAVWLMGVWERSPAGLAIARSDPGLDAAMRAALPGLRDEDVIGSPYCVRDYVVDPRFGDLATARTELAARGLKLILDYVPNHVAPDHPWVPEHCIRGSEADLAGDPTSWLRVGDAIVARGRDPYFPAWQDVVQLDAFSPALRAAVRALLRRLAGMCDGLRCDMAMLMDNAVFARTWSLDEPDEEFWPPLIERVRRAHPGFTFIAEAYWDMEYTLQQQGFDYCYDKRLYDRLAHEDASAVRGHLLADLGYQERLLRFIENHDEPRAAATFGPRARAAAVVMSTVPGARLFHDGQLDGFRTHVSVFLARGPVEAPDPEVRDVYSRLLPLEVTDWRLCELSGWPGNDTTRNLLAWSFTDHLVVVNLSGAPAQGKVQIPRGRWTLIDLLSDARYERLGGELYVGLEAWGAHVLHRV